MSKQVRTNYILIDYENVQPTSLVGLDQAHFKIIVFIGVHQTKISVDVAAALQCLGPRAEYIKIAGNGPNALDFHIAFYIGQVAAVDPTAYFHIISKDTGFDPLIQHLKQKHILACRSHDIRTISVVKIAQATSVADRIAVIVTNLQQRGASKPRTVKTLRSSINALFHQSLSEADVSALIHELHTQGMLTINDTKIAYTLPTQAES